MKSETIDALLALVRDMMRAGIPIKFLPKNVSSDEEWSVWLNAQKKNMAKMSYQLRQDQPVEMYNYHLDEQSSYAV